MELLCAYIYIYMSYVIYVRVLRNRVDHSYSTVSTTRGPVIPVQELYSTPVVGRWSDMDGAYGVLV